MKNIALEKQAWFIGLSKQEVQLKLVNHSNLYFEKEWVYMLKKSWFGKKTVLFIEFDIHDKVIAQYTVSGYGKI